MTSFEESRKFLDPQVLSSISNYRLLARLMVSGFFMGQHRGPRHAFSLEYSDRRDYYPGDPLKLIDWKIYGKTDKFLVKEFEEETNLEAWLVVDMSQSMSYRGEKTAVTKLQYASYLAAAFAYLLIGQKDLVGLILFDERLRKVIPPSSTHRQLNVILGELSRLKPGGVSHFEQAARLAAGRIKKRSLVILFSDLLSRPEDVEKTLKHFLCHKNELIVFHILSFEEMKFPFQKFGFFEDLETKHRILLQPTLLQEEYQRQMRHYLEAVKRICMKLRLSYQMAETTTSFDRALFTLLQFRSRMN